MLSIPPHSSQRTQPLDVSFYEPLKIAYRNEYNGHMKTHLICQITPYDVAGLFNKAYAQVGFQATRMFPLNSNVFTDQDFLEASLMEQESEQIIENQDPSVQNIEDIQSDDIAIIYGHVSPSAGPSNMDQCSESVTAKHSNKELVNDTTHDMIHDTISFASITATPIITSTRAKKIENNMLLY